MVLSNDQAQRFQDHLRAANISGDCPICRRPLDWVQVAELVAVPSYARYQDARTLITLVRCVCPHCAAVTTFDAAALDITPNG